MRYRRGEASAEMERAAEKVQWINAVMGGRWAPPGDRLIPSYDQGVFDTASRAAKTAVRSALAPLVISAEGELERATAERDRIARGR